jgi:heptosyltransferase-2
VTCENCVYERIIKGTILIIKLDAIGDVLRTTGLLEPLATKFPDFAVTWVTKKGSLDLFRNNPYVYKVIEYGSEAQLNLATSDYDVAINLDAAEPSCRLMSLARADSKIGFSWNPNGYAAPLNPEAEQWFQMGLWDDLKKVNQRTYQDLMMEICGLEGGPSRPVFVLEEQENAFARAFAEKYGIVVGKHPVIGLNTGAGGRWLHKRWTLDGFKGLIRTLEQLYPDSPVLLYGGPEEVERNAELATCGKNVIHTGCDNNLRQFGALVSLCDLIVAGDTLAMHIGIALEKKMVVLFGPTSLPEIELYGSGIKIAPEGMECLCCYRPDCEVRPTCMERISVEQVVKAIQGLLS